MWEFSRVNVLLCGEILVYNVIANTKKHEVYLWYSVISVNEILWNTKIKTPYNETAK